jgi:hypothetical protein
MGDKLQIDEGPTEYCSREGSSFASHSGRSGIKSQPGDWLPRSFLWFASLPPGNCQNSAGTLT